MIELVNSGHIPETTEQHEAYARWLSKVIIVHANDPVFKFTVEYNSMNHTYALLDNGSTIKQIDVSTPAVRLQFEDFVDSMTYI